MAKRQLPFSREAENHVLGSILIDPNLSKEYCGRLSTDDFYDERNKKIYDVIEKLYLKKKEVDIIGVIEGLKQAGYYQEINENYLFELAESVPTVLSTEQYVEVLKEKSLERELYNEVMNLSQRVLKGEEDVSDILASAEKNIGNISNKQKVSNLVPISVAIDAVIDIIDKNRERSADSLIGLDTGFRELNEYTFGFQPGELIILAARPGVGKSAFALNVAAKSCLNTKGHVAFFSLEMGIDQLIMRLLSLQSNVKLGKIRSGNMDEEETSRLLAGRVALDNLHIYLDETTTNDFESIKIQCRKLKRENKLDMIIIDYLQLLTLRKGKSMSRYEEVSGLSRNLKLLAKELKVPVLALSQLSRNVESRTQEQGNKPILSDLRESGSIEQDADIVLFLHREAQTTDDPTKGVGSRKIEVIIAKNRQGMTGSFPLIFRGECSSFDAVEKKK